MTNKLTFFRSIWNERNRPSDLIHDDIKFWGYLQSSSLTFECFVRIGKIDPDFMSNTPTNPVSEV